MMTIITIVIKKLKKANTDKNLISQNLNTGIIKHEEIGNLSRKSIFTKLQ